MDATTLPKGAMSAEMACRFPELLLVDIRPIEERRDILGYIPASVSVPGQEAFAEAMARVETLVEASRAVVLVCQSGRRAQHLYEQHPRLNNKTVLYLHGGIIAWLRAGFPIAGVNLPTNTHFSVASQQDIFKTLSSCFTAELIESSLNSGAKELPNPLDILGACFKTEGVDPANPDREGIMRVLDRAAIHSWRTGTTLERIRDNLDDFQAALDAVVLEPLAQAG